MSLRLSPAGPLVMVVLETPVISSDVEALCESLRNVSSPSLIFIGSGFLLD